MAYSSPVPDLLGTANVSSDQVYWEEQSDGLLTDEAYGLQDIHLNSILTYGELFSFHGTFNMHFQCIFHENFQLPTVNASKLEMIKW